MCWQRVSLGFLVVELPCEYLVCVACMISPMNFVTASPHTVESFAGELKHSHFNLETGVRRQAQVLALH